MSKHHAMRTAMQFPRLGSASRAILLRPLPLYNAADRELRPCRKLAQAATHNFLENPCNYQRVQLNTPRLQVRAASVGDAKLRATAVFLFAFGALPLGS